MLFCFHDYSMPLLADRSLVNDGKVEGGGSASGESLSREGLEFLWGETGVPPQMESLCSGK